MSKIKTHSPAVEHEHDIRHAHVDFEKKTISYQHAVGSEMHHAELDDALAAEILAHIEAHLQFKHDAAAKKAAEEHAE